MKALIVDDNEINAMLAAELLDTCGVASATVTSGAEAIERIKQEQFGLILMDYIMPGMNGLEASKLIREFSNVPIYAMSGDMDKKLLENFRDAGAQGMVQKPFKAQEIEELVRHYGEELMPERNEEDNSLTGQDREAVAPGTGVGLKECLSCLPELDYETGLCNALGKEQSFSRILSAAVKNFKQYNSKLESYINKTDNFELKLATHSIAGICANIGAEGLRSAAKAVEGTVNLLLETGTGSADEKEVSKLSEMVGDFCGRLETALDGYERRTRGASRENYSEVPETALDAAAMAEVIAYTKKALERFEVDYIMEGLDHLKRAYAGESRKKIETAIEAACDFDYETVENILAEITTL